MAADFLLNPLTWDMMVDGSGDIAVCTGGFAIAQNAANAIRLFLGEYFYDTTLGQNWFGTTLGKMPPLQLVKAEAIDAALSVQGVASAKVFFSSFAKRAIGGQVVIVTSSGQTVAATFSVTPSSGA